MNSTTFSSKSSSWFKTKVLSLFGLVLFSFLLVGCGSSGGGSSGNNSSNVNISNGNNSDNNGSGSTGNGSNGNNSADNGSIGGGNNTTTTIPPKSSDKELTGFTFAGGIVKPATIDGATVDTTIYYASTYKTPIVTHTGVRYSPTGAIDFANLPVNYRITAEDGSSNNYQVIVRRAFIVSSATELSIAIDTINSTIANNKYITILVTNDINLTSNKTIPLSWAGKNIILENNSSTPLITITGLTIEDSSTVTLANVKVIGSNSGGSGEEAQIWADCSGANCGVNAKSYTGSGVGIWRYTNNAASSTNLSISLSNVAGKDVMVVFTNEKNSSVSFPSNAIKGKFYGDELAPQIAEPYIGNFNDIPEQIRYFDKKEMLRQAATESSLRFLIKPLALKEWQVGNQANWYVIPKTIVETRKATLIKQTSSGNRTINFWVEDGEFGGGKVTQTMLDSISDKFTNNIYGNVLNIAGEPWGATGSGYGNSLIDANQPLDIVFVNFDRNNLSGGMVGYFWSLNNMRKNVLYPYSNEALVFFADTEMLYLTQNGINIMLSTLAHELTHMINFYQRDVKMSEEDVYDTFLEEMTAIMMEDIIGSKIENDFNDVRDSNYRGWLSGALYNCDFTDWENCGTQSVNSYHTAGSFGAYLLRHYGIDFYKNLLKYPVPRPLSINDRQNSIALLDDVIKTKTYNTEGLGRAVQRWGANIALLPAAYSPKDFGYPERSEGSFYLSAFDGDNFKSIRSMPPKPSTLNGYGNYPLKRNITANQYEENVIVPSGVSVTVIVK
jgi:hypothetical protein